MSKSEITLEYALDELKFTGEPGEPRVVEFFGLILRRVKMALKATRGEFASIEGQTLLVDALPSASLELKGKLALLQKSGAANDELYVCRQQSGGAYAWVLVV